MPALVKGYEYDIFISYRQKDNKADKWVTHFVEALKDELEATFKEDICVYFDENPHDGLLETHDVDQSLQEKIKVLVFIPIISQTYCDPKSFAWQKEFIAFRDFVINDELGLDIRLSSGNVCKRILPVRIHEIDIIDQELYEKETGGLMRPVDFIYKESGVNRPLRWNEENPNDNVNHTTYRNQINKVANGVKEIIDALKSTESDHDINQSGPVKKTPQTESKISVKSITITSVLTIILALTAIWYFKFYNQPQVLSEASRNSRIAIIPFENNTNDPELDVLGDMAADWITKGLMSFDHIKLISYTTTRDNIEFVKSNDSSSRSSFINRTGANKKITGSFYLYDDQITLHTQLIDIESGEVEFVLPTIRGNKRNLEGLVNDLNQKVMTIYRLDSVYNASHISHNPPKYQAYKYYIKSLDYFINDYEQCRKLLSEAIKIDSSFLSAYLAAYFSYENKGMQKEADSVLGIINRNFQNPLPIEQLMIDGTNAKSNSERYRYSKILLDKEPKNLLWNINTALYASQINRPHEVISICQNINPEDFPFKNPDMARWWFGAYSYNLIRLNQSDKVLKILETVPAVHMGYLSIYKALAYVLLNQPNEVHDLIEEMELNGADLSLILSTYLYSSDVYYLKGDSLRAIEWAQMGLEVINSRSDKNEINQFDLAWSYFNCREYEKAIQLYSELSSSSNGTSLALGMSGLCYAKSGKKKKALELINKLKAINTPSSKYYCAQIYTALGLQNLAVEYLIDAFKEDYEFFLGRFDTDYTLTSLRGHQGYEEFINIKYQQWPLE